MASTPNYNWSTPDNTGLVKNGALDIRTLGNAIDATMATMTPKSLVDAKGDLVTATANDTPARLAVGNNGETLVADSSTATGLRYQVPVNSNPVLNSSFQVWQRGTSFAYTGSVAYNADRWCAYNNGTSMTISRQLTNDATNLPNIQYCARIQRNAGSTNLNNNNLIQSLETVNSIPYSGKTVTVSFYARAGANYSTTGSTVGFVLANGTGTDQNFLSAYTGTNYVISQSPVLTTTWQRFTYTGTIPTNSTELTLYFNNTPTGTAGAADYFEITGVQLEVGSVATPFKTYAGTIQGELAACQRYYWRVNAAGESTYPFMGFGAAYSTTQTQNFLSFPVQMRVKPTAIEVPTTSTFLQVSDATGATQAVSSIGFNSAITNTNAIWLEINVASGLTQYRNYTLRGNNSTGAYLGITAEL